MSTGCIYDPKGPKGNLKDCSSQMSPYNQMLCRHGFLIRVSVYKDMQSILLDQEKPAWESAMTYMWSKLHDGTNQEYFFMGSKMNIHIKMPIAWAMTLRYPRKIQMFSTTPQGSLKSSSYSYKGCLANLGSYLNNSLSDLLFHLINCSVIS
jgi:hypothetical protein